VFLGRTPRGIAARVGAPAADGPTMPDAAPAGAGGGGGRRRPPGPGPGRPVTVVPHGPGMVLATWAVVLAAGYVPAW
ncbi:hypothetical protein MTQ17_05450, partial [Corynebacterium bovis]